MAYYNESPARGFRILILGMAGLFLLISSVIIAGFMQFTPKSNSNVVKIMLNGYQFQFSDKHIRAHAIKNGETQEVTVLIDWVPDPEITASITDKFTSKHEGAQEGITVVLRSAEGELNPQERVNVLYQRFLTGAPFAGPEGLSGRVFTPNSAYDGEVLYTNGNNFSARCEQAISTETGEFCLRDLRLGEGKIDATIRFPRQFLSEWKELDKNVLAELEKARE